ncbi:MAG: glycosyltransferase, partial [Chloroflexi bacterium]|nr:glycosyltransferase [Chloroflexota bacterium]
SRIHGYDLYEERYSPPYWPGRPASIEIVDALFADATAGVDYLKKRYPAYSSRFETGFLGVVDPGFITAPSSDGVLRVASCSIIRPVKRVELLLAGIANAASQRPEQKIEWHHFGNGASEGVRESLQKAADEILPTNAHAFFPGYSTQQALMDYYRSNAVDVFFNVSESEGIPVSSMEVISCGIPLSATDVGGNREIVTEQNGLLLSANPSAEEIASAIFKFADAPQWAKEKRLGSRALWREKYDVGENFRDFIRRLKTIR